jgi:hypothetical protein
MTFPPNDSPFWPLARQVAVSVVFLIGASTLYRNGMSTADLIALATLLAGVFGVDMVQRQVNKAKVPAKDDRPGQV